MKPINMWKSSTLMVIQVALSVLVWTLSRETTGFSIPPQETQNTKGQLPKQDNKVQNFEGHQVIRVENNRISDEARDFLDQLYAASEEFLTFDFWRPPTRSDLESVVDISAAPAQATYLKTVLTGLNAPYEILVENLQRNIEESAVDAKRQESAMSWDVYHPLNTIYNWLDNLAREYPANVEILEIGQSFENRSLKVVHISSSLVKTRTENESTLAGLPSGGSIKEKTAKPAIWLDGGIHAREWVSPATVTFIIRQLLQEIQSINDVNATKSEASSGNSTAGQEKLVDLFDWYIMPVVNPDGYSYSWTNHRMWRKTRSKSSYRMTRSDNAGNDERLRQGIWDQIWGRCVGADPNRNFNFQWGGKGTSRSHCSDIYHGPAPASEPEIAAVQNFILDKKEQLKLFLTLHSYSQMILIPWGYDTVPNEDFDELEMVALNAASAIESVHGMKYRVGNTVKLLGPAAGSSKDWAKGVAKIKHSYAFELRDTGKHAFLLPAVEIIPTAEETMAGVRSMANDIRRIYSL